LAGSSPLIKKASETSGLKWAPEIGAKAAIVPNSTAPTQTAIINRPRAADASNAVTMCPAPKTVATIRAVPKYSAKCEETAFMEPKSWVRVKHR
jgi:hypothetical protein